MTRSEVLAQVMDLVSTLAAEWDFSEEITASTRLFADMNWQSVDMVVLANEIQTLYGQTFPFADFFERLRGREDPGISIGELADFVFENLSATASPTNAGKP